MRLKLICILGLIFACGSGYCEEEYLENEEDFEKETLDARAQEEESEFDNTENAFLTLEGAPSSSAGYAVNVITGSYTDGAQEITIGGLCSLTLHRGYVSADEGGNIASGSYLNYHGCIFESANSPTTLFSLNFLRI